MGITAARLGSAPVTLDWSHLTDVTAGTRTYKPDAALYSETWSKLKSRFDQKEIGFFDAPVNNELSRAEESVKLAETLLAMNRFDDCLFLGIGGSSLGPICLLNALEDRRKTPIRFHFLENPDPLDWKSTIKNLRPEKTLICAVTKSGTTFETMSQLLLALEWVGKERWKTHVIAITDPEKGDLRAFARNEGLQTLSIAPSIGGRFSIFSPVGLFPAALAGLSVGDFLLGAKQVHDYMGKAPAEKNAIFILADELLRHAAKRSVHVCMPYSTRLKTVGNWFVQLWGESLGKDGKGFTPLAALGTNDQHSIIQLLRDGPDDKVTLFITLDQVEDPVKIPKTPSAPGLQNYPAFKILEHHTLQELLQIEYRATSLVLTKKGRPNATFQLDRLDERTMGSLFFAFSVLTAFTGTMMGINPFDQPGVEEGKVYIKESLNEARAHDHPDDEDNSPVARLRRDRE
jgi:glucose-6-phosphate isomerase